MILLYWQFLSAQEGFSLLPFENIGGSSIVNVISSSPDEIVTYGLVKDSFGQHVAIAKFDTSGQILNHIIFEHPDSLKLSIDDGYGIVQLEDYSYLCTGVVFNNQNTFILKLSEAFEVLLYQEIDHPNGRGVFPKKVIEIDSSIYVVGTKQRLNFFLDIYVMKFDQQGNFLWERVFGELGMDELLHHVNYLNQDSLLIMYASRSNRTIINNYLDGWIKSYRITIDLDGNLINEELGEENIDGVINSIIQNNQSEYVFGAGEFINSTVWETWLKKVYISKRDSNWNLMWRTFPIQNWAQTVNFEKIIEPQDGGYLGAGNWWHRLPQPEGDSINCSGGSLFKVDADGKPLWQLCDTIDFGPGDDVMWHRLTGAVELISGNIITVGHAIVNEPGPTKNVAWMAKYDKNGCRNMICGYTFDTTTGIVPFKDEAPQIKLYPNPTSGIINIDDLGHHVDRIRVFNLFGSEVLPASVSDNIIDMSNLPSGEYLIEYWISGKRNIHKVIKL